MGSFKMKNILIATGAAVMLAALATPAAAMVNVEPGAYLFTAADGSQQTYTVTIDGMGVPAVTGFGVGFNEICKVSGTEVPTSLVTGWGFGGDYEIDTANGNVTIAATGNYFTFDIVLHFRDNGQATNTGTITSYGVTLYPTNPFVDHPTHALLCESPKQLMAFTSFTPPSAEPAISEPHIAKSVGAVE